MKKIGIFAKKGERKAAHDIKEFIRLLKGRKCKFYIEDDIASVLKIKGTAREDIPSMSDIIIVFGGDGTLLSVARLVGDRGVPIIGVNLGGLGFITELSRDEVKDNIDMIFSDECCVEERIMLLATVYRGKKKIVSHNALNDVVLNKSALSRMFDDGSFAFRRRPDSLSDARNICNGSNMPSYPDEQADCAAGHI
jgi:NAD+ kinase